MKKKYLALAAVLVVGVVFVNSSLFSRSVARPYPHPGAVDVFPDEYAPRAAQYDYDQASQGEPVFEDGKIKLKAVGFPLNRMRCGGITLVPKIGAQVQVRAQRYSPPHWIRRQFGYVDQPGKPISRWVDVDPAGLRVKYDRAGLGATHYKVFCRLKGRPGTVDCSRVLTIQNAKEGHCSRGPGGVDARYEPLNMKKK